jgi:cell division protein FtsL
MGQRRAITGLVAWVVALSAIGVVVAQDATAQEVAARPPASLANPYGLPCPAGYTAINQTRCRRSFTQPKLSAAERNRLDVEARRLAAEEKVRAAEAKTTRCQISRRNEPNSRRRRTARRRGGTSRH